jgi:hypothetical protein
MSRVPQKLCARGSQRWMQWFVNHAPHVIDDQIGLGPIDWRSPLRDDEYAEYRDAAFLERIGVTLPKRPLDAFWPRGGPQWDALGRAATSEAVIVEAKAHLNELYSPATGASESSLALVRASLAEAAASMNVPAGFDWSKQFYQYANRIAHAYLLDHVNGVPVKLVFVYFIGDTDMKVRRHEARGTRRSMWCTRRSA